MTPTAPSIVKIPHATAEDFLVPLYVNGDLVTDFDIAVIPTTATLDPDTDFHAAAVNSDLDTIVFIDGLPAGDYNVYVRYDAGAGRLPVRHYTTFRLT